jgi:hypothetical protein
MISGMALHHLWQRRREAARQAMVAANADG